MGLFLFCSFREKGKKREKGKQNDLVSVCDFKVPNSVLLKIEFVSKEICLNYIQNKIEG